MRDSDGVIWQRIRISEDDRNALAVARRLVLRTLRELGPGSDAWSNGAGGVEPQAVLINLDRMIEDWDLAAADDSDLGQMGP